VKAIPFQFFQHGDVYHQRSGSFVVRRWLIVDLVGNQCLLLSEANEMHRRAGRDPFLGRVLSLSFGQRILCRPFQTVPRGEIIILTFHLQKPRGKIPSHFVTHLNIAQSADECQVIDQHFPPVDESARLVKNVFQSKRIVILTQKHENWTNYSVKTFPRGNPLLLIRDLQKQQINELELSLDSAHLKAVTDETR
jgi:hypothetical protein